MTRYGAEEKKKQMLAKMVIRRKVGGSYTPRERIYSGIPKDERGDLEQLLDELWQEGFIEYHKGRNCVSIHRRNKDWVREYLEGEVPKFYWDSF